MPDSAEPAAVSQAEDEAIRRQILLALAAIVAFVLCAGVALAVTRGDAADDDEGGLVSASEALVGTGTGPLAGTDVAIYTEGRRRALVEARGRWVAVVSLRDYATEADVKRDYASLDIKALLVATEGGEPEVVEGSLVGWATEARGNAEEERTQLQSMASSTDDAAFKAQFNADIDRLGKLLGALDPAKPVVFGLVAVAPAAELRTLSDRAGVRLIDVVARRTPSSLVRLRGLRPEETVRAGDPRTRPV